MAINDGAILRPRAELQGLGEPGDDAIEQGWVGIDDTATWQTAYSQVDGPLPPEDSTDDKVVFARGFLNVLVAGQGPLKINSTKGLQLRLDGREIKGPGSELNLKVGRHALTYRIDSKARQSDSGPRVELETPTGFPLIAIPDHQ